MSNETIPSYIAVLPSEILMKIFSYLSGIELVKCRAACRRWNSIISTICLSDVLWQDYCKTDYTDTYQIAKLKSRPQLQWFQIYKSLSLWPKLTSAREIRYEFASACHVSDEIKNFTILRNGIIGVHKHNRISYYDVQTMKETKESPISGQFLRYTENDELILTLTYHLQLQIIKKVENSFHEIIACIENVKCFLLNDRSVYYVTLSDEVCISEMDKDFKCKFITHVEDGVMTIGHGNHLNVLTFRRHICSLIDDKLIEVCCLDKVSNPFHRLRKYNFLEHFDWRIYFQWMYVLNHSIPEGLGLGDIVTVRSYGDIVFIGSNWGMLRIYHAPFSAEQFDLNNAIPMKQYNFMEFCDSPAMSMCPIIQVDVMEAEDGHTVFVAMPKKIAVINFI